MKLSALLTVALLFSVAPALAQSLEELEEEIKTKRDEVDEETIVQLAEIETRDALDALLRSYERFGSIYMRREVVYQLKRFDEYPDAFEPALEHLMNVAVGDEAVELRAAALNTLGECPQNGASFLSLIVESPAANELRERAMELHVRLGGPDYSSWYRKIYERDSKKAKKEFKELEEDLEKSERGRKKNHAPPPKVPAVWPTAKLRATALGAISEELSEDDLVKAFEKDLSMSVRRTALTELASRNYDRVDELAEDMLERVNVRGTDRAFAAEVLLDARGTDAADDLIDLALKATTPAVLREAIADMLVELDDEDVNGDLAKMVGKGRDSQRVFALRATRHIDDEKLVKKVRRDLRSKEPELVIATVDALAARRDRESIEDMEKIVEKTKDDEVRAATLAALSTIYDGENDWVDRLVVMADHEDLDIGNAALNEIARLGRSNMSDLFLTKLTAQNWSTRLVALHALEAQRKVEHLEPIIDQMGKETGRMSIEFSDSLFRLTGKPFGRRQSSWKSWVTSGDDVELVPKKEVDELIAQAEERRLREVYEAKFFGIRIESHRVLFIIDVSGSMNDPVRTEYVGESGRPRIEVAKDELKKAIEALEPGALFNIMPFSGGVETWLEEGVVGTNDSTREEALEYVDRLGALGGTNLYGALALAFDDEDIDTIFVLSDGEPSVGDIIDPQLIREDIAERNQTRGIVINTVAIGGNLEVLAWLAEDSGGTHVNRD